MASQVYSTRLNTQGKRAAEGIICPQLVAIVKMK